MEELQKEVLSCEDLDSVRNVIRTMFEHTVIGMNDACALEMYKEIKSEVSDCHYDDEMANLHLCLIGQLHTADVAKDYWHEVKSDKITLADWIVLWGEMVRRNDAKIRSWFPNARKSDYERKVFDECVSFLDNGELPFYDLKV